MTLVQSDLAVDPFSGDSPLRIEQRYGRLITRAFKRKYHGSKSRTS
jgi:hypothetical protein